MRFPKPSKEVKQTLMGGAIAGAIVGIESGMNWFVAGYPQFLKDKLNPNLPRNGALLADLAPAGYAYMVKKKGGSAKKENMANGMLFYDLPKLLDQVVTNVAYSMGSPQVRFGNMSRTPMPLKLNIRPAMTNGVAAKSFGYPQTAGTAGKYALKVSTPKASMGGGIGKYR